MGLGYAFGGLCWLGTHSLILRERDELPCLRATITMRFKLLLHALLSIRYDLMAKKRAAKNRQRATCYGGAFSALPENISPDLSQKGKVHEILARETGITPKEARSVISVVEIQDRKLEDLIIEKQIEPGTAAYFAENTQKAERREILKKGPDAIKKHNKMMRKEKVIQKKEAEIKGRMERDIEVARAHCLSSSLTDLPHEVVPVYLQDTRDLALEPLELWLD
jgi:hypothetical protein